ncbi:MAG: hypothetical protein M3Y27_02280 [Acidobacteriota bacterium]|nr:hypothetical protein [Acidobacteriota bacterium]
MPDEQKKDEQKNDEQKKDSEGVLVGAAKALGSAAGKVASLAGAAEEKPTEEKPVARKRAAKPAAAKPAPPKPEYKEGTYKATYLGSGTFIITKPKRKKGKLQQSRLKGTVRGARK